MDKPYSDDRYIAEPLNKKEKNDAFEDKTRQEKS